MIKNKQYLLLLGFLFMFFNLNAQVENGKSEGAINRKEVRLTSWQEGFKLRIDLGLGVTASSSLEDNIWCGLLGDIYLASYPKISFDYAINQDMQFGISLVPIISSGTALIPSLDFRGYLGSPERNWRFFYNAQLGIALFASDALAFMDKEVYIDKEIDNWNSDYYPYVYSESSNFSINSKDYVEEIYYGNLTADTSLFDYLDSYYPYQQLGLNFGLSAGMEFKRGFFFGISYTLHQGKWDKYGFKRWKFEGSDEWFYGKIEEAGVEKFFSHSIMLTTGWNIPLSKRK